MRASAKGKLSAGYSPAKAGGFWDRRLRSTNALAAVLTYTAPRELNQAYDRWERRVVDAALGRSLRGRSAVDMGAGTGRITLLLAARGAAVTAVDVSAEMLGRLKQRARAAGLARLITPVVADAGRLPVSDKAAAQVTCCGLLEHLPVAARRAALREAFRVLAPKGKMIAVVNNAECLFLRGSYPMTIQRTDGYFAGLVGLPWLAAEAHAAGLTLRVCAANPWYACAYHLATSSRGGNWSALKALCRRLPDLDCGVDPTSTWVAPLASHYIVELRYR